jgi:acetamidase/formamidase
MEPINVSVRLTIQRGDEFKHVIYPCLLTQSDMKTSSQYYSVLGIADNMLEATKQAIRQMIIYLEQTKGLTREEAYMLCSIAVDIRVTQVLDTPNYTIGAFLLLDIFVNEN